MPSRELRKYADIAQELNPDDIAPINSMINAALHNTHGKPAAYPNTEAGMQAFTENSLAYFEYVAKANSMIDEPKRQLILDIDSWSVFMGISKKTILEYQKRNDAWDKLISLFKDAIGASKKQLALHNLIPSIMAIFDLTNNHGYVNASEFKLTAEEAAHVDKKDIESQLMDAGLIWDPERGEFISMSQEGDNHVDTGTD